MNSDLILAFDHGTSGIKAAVVDPKGAVHDFVFEATSTNFLPGGGAEQDPDEWWNAAVAATRALLERTPAARRAIRAVAVSSTFSTTVAVGADNRPVLSALSWMDSRGAAAIAQRVGGFPSILGYHLPYIWKWLRRTGGAPSLSGKDDAAHVALIADRWPDAYHATEVFLPSKDYLNLKLTGRRAASFDSMQLFWVSDTRDPFDVHYTEDLISLLHIDRSKLPEMRGSTDILGPLQPDAVSELGLSEDVLVVGGSPDHQCALLGSGAIRPFEAHLYIGTSSWIECLVPIRKTDPFHSIASFPTFTPGLYQCINEQDLAGGALEFLRTNLVERAGNLLGAAPVADMYELLNEVADGVPPGSNGILFAPWLNGERTPVDDHHARGAFIGLSTTSRLDDLVRAVLEGVACNTRWSLEYVERFTKRRLDPIRIIGGGAQSDLWCQIFADVLQRQIQRVVDPLHANVRGAAFLAAMGMGWTQPDEIPDLVGCDRTFEPCKANQGIYDRLYRKLVRFYRANRGIFRL